MKKPSIIHIVGASGAGTSTLGQALERDHGYKWLDTDGYFWQKTDPPFVKSLLHEERVKLMSAVMQENPKCVISGSLCGWGDVFIPKFDLVVFVDTPVDIRIERLQKREYERFGDRIREGGDMFEEHKKFIVWAASYDTGGLDMRSLALHERWLADLPCPVIRVDGTEDYRKTAAYVAECYRQISEGNIFTPESQGISSNDVIELIEEFERRDYQVTSFMLLRNGHKIAEFCKPPYGIDSVQLWFSVTKSITGIGIGIACDKGHIALDNAVINFFPDKLPETISDNLAQMRVHHLLSMTSGIHENTYGLLYPQEDWVKAFLAQDFPHEPGTFYRYSTHGSHMLAAIVERVTGQSFYSYIKTNLFELLEIRESTWETDSQGITAGGMGLGLTLGSVAKFAQMILDKGTYNGKRIVSEEYLSSAMTEQADDREQEKDAHTNGQGFHMQIDNDGSVFHSGAFGQLWFACPKKNIAVVLTSRRTKTYTDEVVDLIQKKTISRASDKALPESGRYEQMKDYLNSLEYSVPVFRDIPQNTPSLDGKSYMLSDNPHGLQSVEFMQEEMEKLCVRLKYTDRPVSIIDVSFIEPVHGQDVFVKDIQFHEQKYVSYAAWKDDKTLVLTIFYIETPYEVTYRFTFGGMNINITFHMNVSLNLKNFECDGILSETDAERRARIYPVILSEYNPEWPGWYAKEKANLERLLGNRIVRIQHIGSTAVPGLTAKPTIDILLEAATNIDIEDLIAPMPAGEYICLRREGNSLSEHDRVMFLKGYTDTGFADKVFHIHVRNHGDWDECHFRDYLITHPDTATEYAELKRRLFKDYEHDRDGYTAAKGAFIKEVTKKAKERA